MSHKTKHFRISFFRTQKMHISILPIYCKLKIQYWFWYCSLLNNNIDIDIESKKYWQYQYIDFYPWSRDDISFDFSQIKSMTYEFISTAFEEIQFKLGAYGIRRIFEWKQTKFLIKIQTNIFEYRRSLTVNNGFSITNLNPYPNPNYVQVFP